MTYSLKNKTYEIISTEDKLSIILTEMKGRKKDLQFWSESSIKILNF